MARILLLVPLTFLAGLVSNFSAATVKPAGVPPTPKKPVTDVYHGVKVVDSYRWLENGQDLAVKRWSKQQNDHARAVLDCLPGRASIRKRLQKLYGATSPDYVALRYRGGI